MRPPASSGGIVSTRASRSRRTGPKSPTGSDGSPSPRTARPWRPREYDGTVRIRDAATGKVLTQWLAHPGGVQCLKFTRDGRTLVTCGKDGTAKVWDLATREGQDDDGRPGRATLLARPLAR